MTQSSHDETARPVTPVGRTLAAAQALVDEHLSLCAMLRIEPNATLRELADALTELGKDAAVAQG